MKKQAQFGKVLTLLGCLLLVTGLHAQNFTISGTVSDINANPIANQAVTIYTDSLNGNPYYNTVFTNASGAYSDVIPNIVSPGNQVVVWASTTDCNQANVQDTTSTGFGTQSSGVVDFTICAPPACQASFFAYADSIAPLSYFFSNGSFGSQPLSYSWSFGDGNTSTALNPTHSYSVPGTYNVCLSIMDSTGCSDSTCQVINVTAITCAAAIQINSAIGLSLDVSDGSFGTGPVTASWDLGDGTMVTGPNVQHTYANPGTYTICLTINDSTGCSDTACTTLTFVNPGPSNLSGLVTAGGNIFSEANVYLIQFDSATNLLTAVDTVMTDTANFFIFPGVAPGNYLVKAALKSTDPDFANFLPTYYGDSLFWNGATTISAPTNTLLTINLIAGNNQGGPGFVAGNVGQGANKMAGPGDPIAGAQVMVLDMNDNPVQYQYSDNDGNFSFNDLQLGTYQLYTEIAGLNTTPAIVTLDATNPSATGIQIEVGEQDITTGLEENFLLPTASVSLYPNPVSDLATLEIEAVRSGNVIMTLTNGLGQRIAVERHALNAGNNRLPIQAQSLQTGLYIVQLATEDGAVLQAARFLKE
ncbi:MAG: PKD domain-containing protein [Bacteroidota bacterium]